MKGTTQPLMTILDITCTPVNLYTDITCVQIRHIHEHIDHGSAFIGGIEHLQWYHSLYSPKEITWGLHVPIGSSTCDLYTVYMCFMQQVTLVPRPSLAPVFDCLQCAKMEGEFKAWFIYLLRQGRKGPQSKEHQMVNVFFVERDMFLGDQFYKKSLAWFVHATLIFSMDCKRIQLRYVTAHGTFYQTFGIHGSTEHRHSMHKLIYYSRIEGPRSKVD